MSKPFQIDELLTHALVSNEPNAEEVREWLATQLCDSTFSPLTVLGPVYTGSHSSIFRGAGGTLLGPVAIKICRHPETGQPSPADAELQFSALKRVTASSDGTGEALVPAPILLIRDRAVIVSGWVEGATIGALCRDWRTPRLRITLAVGQGGRWLRNFHALHSLTPRPVATGELLASTEAEVGGLGTLRRPVVTCLRGLSLLRRTAADVAAIPVPRSWTHGDCKPDNLIVAGDRTIGLDTGANFENVVLLDIAHFLNHLEMDFFHPASGCRHIFQRQRFLKAFWNEYDPCSSVPNLPLEWVRLAMMLRLYMSHGRVHGGARGGYITWCFERLIRQRMRALEQQLD